MLLKNNTVGDSKGHGDELHKMYKVTQFAPRSFTREHDQLDSPLIPVDAAGSRA